MSTEQLEQEIVVILNTKFECLRDDCRATYHRIKPEQAAKRIATLVMTEIDDD